MFLCSVFAQYGYLEAHRKKMASFSLVLCSLKSLQAVTSIYNFIGSSLPNFKNESFARYSCIFHWTDNIYIFSSSLSYVSGEEHPFNKVTNNSHYIHHSLEPSCWRMNTAGESHIHIQSNKLKIKFIT